MGTGIAAGPHSRPPLAFPVVRFRSVRPIAKAAVRDTKPLGCLEAWLAPGILTCLHPLPSGLPATLLLAQRVSASSVLVHRPFGLGWALILRSPAPLPLY